MNFRQLIQKNRLSLLVLTFLVALGAAGCSTEPENESLKPWNSPEGWQNSNMLSMPQH